jgi:hypothetical protein
LHVEPIKPLPVLAAVTPVESVACEVQRQLDIPLVGIDGNDPATEKMDSCNPIGWKHWAWRIWSAPARSLRLPSVSSFFTNVERHGWIGKLTVWIAWFSKVSRTRRLAV